MSRRRSSRRAWIGVMFGLCLAGALAAPSAQPTQPLFVLQTPLVLEILEGSRFRVFCDLRAANGEVLIQSSSTRQASTDVNGVFAQAVLSQALIAPARVPRLVSYRCGLTEADVQGPVLATTEEGTFTDEHRRLASGQTATLKTGPLRYSFPPPPGLKDVTFEVRMPILLFNTPEDLARMWVECRVLDTTNRVPANAAVGLAVDLARGVAAGSKGGRRHEVGAPVLLRGHLFFGGRTRDTLDRYDCRVTRFVRKNGSDLVPADVGNTRISQRLTDAHLIEGRSHAYGPPPPPVVVNSPLVSYTFSAR